jgi:hypothetical protein
MTADFARDTAATAVVFGFFAAAWFGWAQDKPPMTWKTVLIAGSVVSLLIAITGGLLVWRSWQDGTVFDADTSRTFGIIVGIEFAAAGLGAGALAVARKADLIPAWVALVVGIHLIPVAWLLKYPLVYVVGGLVTVVALAGSPWPGLAR